MINGTGCFQAQVWEAYLDGRNGEGKHINHLCHCKRCRAVVTALEQERSSGSEYPRATATLIGDYQAWRINGLIYEIHNPRTHRRLGLGNAVQVGEESSYSLRLPISSRGFIQGFLVLDDGRLQVCVAVNQLALSSDVPPRIVEADPSWVITAAEIEQFRQIIFQGGTHGQNAVGASNVASRTRSASGTGRRSDRRP